MYNAGNLDKKVKRRRMDAFKRNTIVSSITGYHDGDGGNSDAFAVAQLDVVIEAVFENLSQACGLVLFLDCRDDCVLGHTSGYLSKVAAGIDKPERYWHALL